MALHFWTQALDVGIATVCIYSTLSDVKASRLKFWPRPRHGLGFVNLASKNVLFTAK